MTAPIPLHEWIYHNHEWETPADDKSLLSHGQAVRLVADWFMTGQTVDNGVSPGWVQRVPFRDTMPRVGPQGPMAEHAPTKNAEPMHPTLPDSQPYPNGWTDQVGVDVTPVSNPGTPEPAPPANNQPNESMRAE